MDSIKAINQLEKHVKGKVRKVRLFKDIARLNSYFLDEKGLLTGLNLCYPNIPISVFSAPPHLLI